MPKEVTLNGETYRSQRAPIAGACTGCAAGPDQTPPDGLCSNLPACCTSAMRPIVWVRVKRPGSWQDMTPTERHATVNNMETMGGSFARAMSHAFAAADSTNVARLAAAFPDLIVAYAPTTTKKD